MIFKKKKKPLQKVGIEGDYLNLIKTIYDKTTANIILSSEKLKAFLSDQEKDKMSTLTTIIQHSFRCPIHGNQRRKRNNKNTNWKWSKTLTAYRWHDPIHKDYKEATRKLLEIVIELIEFQDTTLIYWNFLHSYN